MAIVAGNKFAIPVTLTRYGYLVVTALDKNNNESIGSSPVQLPLNLCSGSGTFFTSQNKSTGNTYQWQVDDGSGFVNITDNANYTGSNADTLLLTATPSSFYGYTYRCVITKGIFVTYGPSFKIKFTATWTGTADTLWENVANWSCGSFPDGNTDVVINSSLTNYPVVNTNVSCRSLKIKPNASVNVSPGFNVEIKGVGN